MKITDEQRLMLIAAAMNGYCANPGFTKTMPSDLSPMIIAQADSIIFFLENEGGESSASTEETQSTAA